MAKKFPVKLRRGSVSVSITQLADSRFVIYWQSHGKQQRRIRMTEQAAREFAREQLLRMSHGVMKPVKSWGECLELAEDFGMSPVAALREWHEWKSKQVVTKISVAKAIEKFLAAKKKAGISERHLVDLKSRVGLLGKHSPSDFNKITRDHLQELLDQMECAPQTAKNYVRCWNNFFNWCKAEKLLDESWNETSRLILPKKAQSEIEIYTPKELHKLLSDSPEQVKPFIAIGAWSGLRTAEIERLEWSDIKDGHIVVEAKKSKTASRRIVPILGPLKKYLNREYKKPRGTDYIHASVNRSKLKTMWKKNALRHSFISYRLAIVKSAEQVSLESGNSTRMIFQHYRELVTESQAKEWFSGDIK